MKDKIARKRTGRPAESDEGLEQFVGKRKKLIILKEPVESVPAGYVQLVLSYKGERLVALMHERVKAYMSGTEGDGFNALDDIANLYKDCTDFEGDLYFEEIFSAPQTEVSTLARASYAAHALNKIVKKGGDGGMELDEEEAERLGLDDRFVEDRVRAMVAIQLGKKAADLRKANLNDLIVDVEKDVEYEKMEAQQVASSIGCCMVRIRTEYVKRTYTRSESFEANPEIARLEKEIEDYRIEKGKEVTPHDNALIRQYANVSFIAKKDPDRQFDVSPPETDYGKKAGHTHLVKHPHTHSHGKDEGEK